MGWVSLDLRSATKAVGTVLFVGLVGFFVVFAVPQVVGVSHSYVVLSSSMSPTLHAGDVVLVADTPPQEVSSGDVITYTLPGESQGYGTDRVTHRVVEVVQQDDSRYFRTKGDANEEPDHELVSPEKLIGTVAFHVPYLGHLVQFAGSDIGLIVLILTPAVLLGLNELVDLKSAATSETSEEVGESSADIEMTDR